MNKTNNLSTTLGLILFTLITISINHPSHAKDNVKGIINDDEVRVRKDPHVKGKYLGVLYKNMVVDVISSTKKKTTIGEQTHKWFKVKHGELTG